MLVMELDGSAGGGVVGRALVGGWVGGCISGNRCERCTRSVELTHGQAPRDLGGGEVTRALAPALVVLLNNTVGN